MFYPNPLGQSIQGSYIGNAGALAGNPFGSDFQIPGKRPIGQPVLPGENKKMIEGVYGQPGSKPKPRTLAIGNPVAGNDSPLASIAMAMGKSGGNIGNVAGFLNPMSWFLGDSQRALTDRDQTNMDQTKQAGFIRKTVF